MDASRHTPGEAAQGEVQERAEAEDEKEETAVKDTTETAATKALLETGEELKSELSELSEQERWERIRALIKVHGLPRRGRPRRGEDRLKWSDLGLTRQDAHIMRKMAEIPKADFDAYFKQPGHRSRRGLLARCGKINVITDDIFSDTPIGTAAERLLAGVEAIITGLDRRERRWLMRALHYRLRALDLKAEMAENPSQRLSKRDAPLRRTATRP